MEFRQFKAIFQENFKQLSKDATHLFEVDLDKDQLWNLYLDSFDPKDNPIYRERREFDCSCCRHFIKNIGNAVVIKDNKVKTIWDFETGSTIYQPVVDALSKYIKSKTVSDIWVSKEKKIGTDRNFEQGENGKVTEWEHFFLNLPDKFVDKSSRSEGDIKGSFRDTRNVFKRSLDEISEESLLTVLELISQNSLYKGEEWKGALTEFLKYKKEYDKLNTINEKENYTWEQSVKVGGAIGRIKNHSIGTLLINISEGMDLDTAVKKYEAIVAPESYKRSKPIYTKQMLEKAKEKIQELGYIDSLQRRFATLEDITINNILFSDKDSAKKIKGNVFDEMLNDTPTNPKKFSKIEEITIENFIQNILPTARKLEIFLENKHNNNMVSLITSENKDTKTMFKWNNNFSWAYSGNITDSSMKENVKSAGGNVEGVLRFSIQWNDDEYNPNDFDAHCIEPKGNEIFYGNPNNRFTTGQLDIDITRPVKNKPAVENITWTNKSKMEDGNYKFFVENYSHNGGRTGFKAEIEFDGQIYTCEYNKELRQKEKVEVAEVTFKNGIFSIKEKLPSNISSKDMWNLKTNQFHNVGVVCYSPNYWDEQQGNGNKHYMFLLKNCINPEMPNAFYVEFLNQELNEHRKVMEAMGSKLKVEDSESQLSGLGFSSTRRNELIIQVESNTKRILKLKF